MPFRRLLAAFIALLALCTAAPARAQTADPYAPYAFLIGDWDTGPEGAPTMFVQRFSWGPNRGYIRFSTSLLRGDTEHLHFEGMLVWNGRSQNLDMLLALEPGSFSQEQGTLHAGPDGVIVREIVATQRDGSTARFRQTFRTVSPNAAATSLMRETPSGWAPNFPGSDNLVMQRRA